MFTEIGLKNIRIFRSRNFNFNLKKLTIFCGSNSSGKSTILKSFLLLRQSQGIYEIYGKRSGLLRFNGSQADLGNYTAFVSDNNIKKNIVISLSIEDTIPNNILKQLINNTGIQLSSTKGTKTAYTLKSNFSFKSIKSSQDSEETGQIKSIAPQGILETADFTVMVKDVVIASWSIKRNPVGASERVYRMTLDPKMFLEWDIPNWKPKRRKTVYVSLDGLLPYSYTDVKTRDRTPALLPFVMSSSIKDLDRALRRIHYLAPLRSASKRYYVANYDITPDLDPKGEFLPYVLGQIIEEPKVTNVLPMKSTIVKQTLSQALNGWLYYIKTGKAFNIRSKICEYEAPSVKDAVVEIKLKATKGTLMHSIADSGFGYSQLLPILVRGLMAPKNSTLMIEQPELHLNPALQVRLADFIIAMLRSGKQVIIETHSEHIVNAIRARTAADKSGFLSSNSTIYFLNTSKGLQIHKMDILPDGTLPEWPKEFFGEATMLAGQLLRSQSQYHVEEK